MIKYLLLSFFIITASFNLFAQSGKDSLSILKNQLESFNYKGVIESADKMIEHKEKLSKSSLIEIYRMKGIAEFSLSDLESAKATFLSLLAIDTSYILDSSNTSPKIIAYFNQTKQNYLAGLAAVPKPGIIIKTDTVVIHDGTSSAYLKQALIRSLIFPGLGHFYLNQSLKGITFTSLTVISLTSMIYYITDSNKRQKDYLNSSDNTIIQSKYNQYNTSYKMRNISILTLAAVWLYSQIDLLFFSNSTIPDVSGNYSLSANKAQLNFHFAL